MTNTRLQTSALTDLPMTVVSQIRKRLAQLERTHNVRVLHAIESGSRAWGFASPDSDYDGRFIYVNEPDWYFSVHEARDVIETPIVDEGGIVFDVNGWDLRKALRLLAKSNPVLIEWLQSPVVYTGAPKFMEEMLVLAQQFHSPRAAHYHYFHMARKTLREHLCGERVRLKKYFYAIRPVLACIWIERGMGIPPMTLTELLDGVMPQGSIRDEILDLREQKIRTPEFGDGLPLPVIQSFLSSEIERLSAISMPRQPPAEAVELDRFLRKWADPNR